MLQYLTATLIIRERTYINTQTHTHTCSVQQTVSPIQDGVTFDAGLVGISSMPVDRPSQIRAAYQFGTCR